MTYASWVARPWSLTNATPGTGSSRFGLSAPGTLSFDGSGLPGSNSNVYFNGSTTPWGIKCEFSSDGRVETVKGIHRATRQPFTITRTVGHGTQSGEVHHPASEREPDPTGHGAGSGCGVWTANDG